jgi:hypothetical protein
MSVFLSTIFIEIFIEILVLIVFEMTLYKVVGYI